MDTVGISGEEHFENTEKSRNFTINFHREKVQHCNTWKHSKSPFGQRNWSLVSVKEMRYNCFDSTERVSTLSVEYAASLLSCASLAVSRVPWPFPLRIVNDISVHKRPPKIYIFVNKFKKKNRGGETDLIPCWRTHRSWRIKRRKWERDLRRKRIRLDTKSPKLNWQIDK